MTSDRTATIRKAERWGLAFSSRTGYRNFVEWVITLPDGRTKKVRTRTEAREWCAEMGYEVQP